MANSIATVSSFLRSSPAPVGPRDLGLEVIAETVLTDKQRMTKLALDAAEERLKAGEKLLIESPCRGRLNKVLFAKEIGLPSIWRLSPFMGRLKAMVAEYGLTPSTLDRYAFADFRVAALDQFATELSAAGAPVVRRETELRDFDAALELAASLAPGASARKTFVAVSLAAAAPEELPETTMAYLARAREMFCGWLKNDNLPRNPAALLRFGVDRSGFRVHEAALKSGLTGRVLHGLIGGTRALTTHYRKIGVLETLLDLPEGSVVEGFRAMPPEEPKPIPPNDGGSHYDWCRDNNYRLYDWPEGAEAEFAAFEKFRTAPIVPRGMTRPLKLLTPRTVGMIRDMLIKLYGSWTTAMNSTFRLDPMDVGMGLLLFSDLLHGSWEFLAARNGMSANAGQPARLEPRDFEVVKEIRRLLDPETGFITQSPGLADRLVPVARRDGTYVVSAEDIARVKADWKGACARALQEYGGLRRSQVKAVKRNDDVLADIAPILQLLNPLKAFAMLCKGVRRRFLKAGRDLAGAEAVRNVVVVGVMTQCAFRAFTMEQLNLSDLVRDPKTGKWWMRVPRMKFKNFDGPYFRIGRTDCFRPFYERELEDKHGLYGAIEAYLGWARGRLHSNRNRRYKTDALFVVSEFRSVPGVRPKPIPSEPGRMKRDYLRNLLHELTAQHVGFDPKTGKGIPGVVSFPTHRFRAILATGVLKTSKGAHPKAEAADAIHDSEASIQPYLRFVPGDREKSLKKTIRQGF